MTIPFDRDLPALSCLLLVAHPDDDAIFAGELQRRTVRHRWTVVFATHEVSSRRAEEARRWQAHVSGGRSRVEFLALPDDPDDRRRGLSTIDEALAIARLSALALTPDLLVTHNDRGEYGHPHHRLVHRMALAVHPDVPRLLFGEGLSTTDVSLACAAKWAAVLEAYPSQRSVIEMFARPHEAFRSDPPCRAAPLLAALGLDAGGERPT